jgi:hypothetical protein
MSSSPDWLTAPQYAAEVLEDLRGQLAIRLGQPADQADLMSDMVARVHGFDPLRAARQGIVMHPAAVLALADGAADHLTAALLWLTRAGFLRHDAQGEFWPGERFPLPLDPTPGGGEP